MLDPSDIVPRHPIPHLLDKDGESQNADIAQLLLGQALSPFKLLRWPFLLYRYRINVKLLISDIT
jgi:hypothetical protein